MTLLDNIKSDLDTMINSDDYAMQVIYTPVGGSPSEISVIWDNADEFRDMVTGEMCVTPLMATVKSADVPGVAKGDWIEKDDVLYYVKSVKDDGTGVAYLSLSEDEL